jgi:hypothetical protein
MGVVDPPSEVMDLRPVNLDSKNYRCRTYTPLITMAVGSMTSATGPCEIVINYANDLWEIHESLVEAHLSAGRKTR